MFWCILFDLIVAIGCSLGVWLGGIFDTIAIVCLVVLGLKILLFIIRGGENGMLGILISAIVQLGIPLAAGFCLGIFAFNVGVLECLFLASWGEVLFGWIATIFDF